MYSTWNQYKIYKHKTKTKYLKKQKSYIEKTQYNYFYYILLKYTNTPNRIQQKNVKKRKSVHICFLLTWLI